MGFWRSLPGTIVIVLLAAVVGLGGFVGWQAWDVLHPARTTGAEAALAAELAHLEGVRFKASDGVDLEGSILRGAADAPAVVLCHDLDESKTSLVNLAIALHKAGFTILSIDFRAHGGSGGTITTLGIAEKRDVLGAVDFLTTQEHADTKRIGVYGTGMGAHAAVLAAADRATLKVLVLDGLYPAASWPLVRRTFHGWPFGIKWLGALPRWAYAAITETGPDSESAADVLPKLLGRDILLVAPAGDTALAAAMQTMYASVPTKQEGSEANLITLPATRTSGLYGDELDRYHARVAEFFASRLGRR